MWKTVVGESVRVLGIAGFKNTGKTTLIVELIREFVARDIRVATIKHAHHNFDIDVPGKDSFLHREAGASQVVVASAHRWAHIHELHGGPEPRLADLLGRISDVDLVLVEGYKGGDHPRLEIRRAGRDAPKLADGDSGICAIVADYDIESAPVPVLRRADVAGIVDFILVNAAPI